MRRRNTVGRPCTSSAVWVATKPRRARMRRLAMLAGSAVAANSDKVRSARSSTARAASVARPRPHQVGSSA